MKIVNDKKLIKNARKAKKQKVEFIIDVSVIIILTYILTRLINYVYNI